jgi:hypothetical protein
MHYVVLVLRYVSTMRGCFDSAPASPWAEVCLHGGPAWPPMQLGLWAVQLA